MIEALDRSTGSPKAIAKCDECGHAQYETCDYERRPDGSWRPNEGQIIHRLTKHGWTNVKGVLRCMACTLKRKAEKPVTENVTPLRQPTREQKRQIIELLGEVYDTEAERYRAAESDVTVADAVGGGCMFGWVAEIREELFGPDGRNEELEALQADLAAWRDAADTLSTKAHSAVKAFDKEREKVAEFQRRVDVLVKAAGPRGRGAA